VDSIEIGLLVFFFGLAVGSFLNVIIFRHNTGEKVIAGRSRCFACGKTLRWHELIPVLSFCIQKGRCRDCRSKISWQYPAVEILTGLLFLFFYLKWRIAYSLPAGEAGAGQDLIILLWWFSIAALLVLLTVYDLKHKILPDRFNYAFLALSFFNIFNDFAALTFLLSLGPAFFLFLLWFISRGRWMGLGDAKLMAAGGIFLGHIQSLVALVLSFWIGAAVGIFLLFLNPNIKLKSEIPFGPFLALGIILAFFFSPYG